jgi:hypothetical protein
VHKKPDFCQSSQITNLKIGSRPKIWPPGISHGKNFGGAFSSSLSKSGSGEHNFEPEIIPDQATDHLRALFVHNCTWKEEDILYWVLTSIGRMSSLHNSSNLQHRGSSPSNSSPWGRHCCDMCLLPQQPVRIFSLHISPNYLSL